MGHTSRRMQDSGTESNIDYESLVQEISEEKNISEWPRDCSHDILVKDMTAFCLCPKKKKSA